MFTALVILHLQLLYIKLFDLFETYSLRSFLYLIIKNILNNIIQKYFGNLKTELYVDAFD